MTERFSRVTIKEVLVAGVPARRLHAETLRDLGGGTFRVMTITSSEMIVLQWATDDDAMRGHATHTVTFIRGVAEYFASTIAQQVNATRRLCARCEYRAPNGTRTNVLTSGAEPELFDGIYIMWEEDQSEVAVLSHNDVLLLALALYAAENG